MAKFLFHLRATLRLAIPVILSQLAQTTLGLTDTIMVGRLGETPLAAVALANTIFFLFLFGGNGLMSAVAPIAAQAHGAEEHGTPGRAARQALWLGFFVSIPVVAFLSIIGDYLAALGQPPDVAALADDYLDILAWGYFPALAFTAMRGMVEAVAKPVVITVIGGGAIFVNILGNGLFIYGWLGAPELGVAGSALSSALVFTGGALVLGLYVAFSRSTREYAVFRAFRTPDPEVMREIIAVGWPIAVSWLLEAGMFSATAYLQGFFGATALASHQVALQSAVFMFNIPLGISIATGVRVGHEAGRKDASGVRWAAWMGIGCSIVFMSVSAVAFVVAPRAVIGLYVDLGDPANADVVSTAIVLLGVAGLFQIADGIQVTTAGALRGLKDTRVPMVIAAIAYWGFGMTTGVVLAFYMDVGPAGLWWGLVAGLGAASVGLVWRLVVAGRRLEHAA